MESISKHLAGDSKYRKIKKSMPYYLIILLPVIYLIVFKYIPMFGIVISFKDYRVSKGIFGSEWVGFKYFTMFFNTPSFKNVMVNTIGISLYSLAASFPLAIILALALNECGNRFFKKTVQMVTYMPYFISTVVLVSMIMQFTDVQVGIVNKLITMFGGDTRNFMGIPQYFKSIYVWTGVWQTTGYSAIIYLAALAGVSQELHEAAIVDGATKMKRIWHIDLPGISSTIVILLLLNVGYILNVGFEKIYLMQNSLNMNTAEVISTYVYKIGLANMNYSFSTAVGLFNSVINLILLLLSNALAKKYTDSSLW